MCNSFAVYHLRDTEMRLKKSLYDGHHNKKPAIRDKYATSDFMEVSILPVLDKENLLYLHGQGFVLSCP